MSKRIVIMGANGGIGEALAKKLGDSGNYELFLTARDTSTIDDLGATDTASFDVDNPDNGLKALENWADDGDIHGFVYCIGSIALKPFAKAKDEDFMNAMNLNHMGAVKALRVLTPALKSGKGSVVLFSSIAVQQGFNAHSVIASAKGAVEGLTKSLAAEYAPDIRFNCIAPSLTTSKLGDGVVGSDAMAQSIAKMHPIPRLGAPEDSANMAAFLLSDDSSWITGQILHVDGGRSSVRSKG